MLFTVSLAVALSHPTLLIWGMSEQPGVPRIRKAVCELLICVHKTGESPQVCVLVSPTAQQTPWEWDNIPAAQVQQGCHVTGQRQVSFDFLIPGGSRRNHLKLKSTRLPPAYSAPSPTLIGVTSLHFVDLFFPTEHNLLHGCFPCTVSSHHLRGGAGISVRKSLNGN